MLWAVLFALWLPIYVSKQSKRWPSIQIPFHLTRGGLGSHDVILVSDWILMILLSRPALRPILYTTTQIHFSLLLPIIMVEVAQFKFSTNFWCILLLICSISVAMEIRKTDPSSPSRPVGCFLRWSTFPCMGAANLNYIFRKSRLLIGRICLFWFGGHLGCHVSVIRPSDWFRACHVIFVSLVTGYCQDKSYPSEMGTGKPF